MSPFKTSLITAALAIITTAGGLYYFQHKQVRESRRLQSQNDRMRAEASRRHAMIAAQPAPVSSSATAKGNATLTSAAAAIPAQQPAEYYRNEGNSTPVATLQTFAWAGDRGDTDMVGRLLYMDAGARAKAEAFMASLPEAGRVQWKNVDEMAAAVLTRVIMGQPFPNADILETATIEPISADRVRLRLPDVPKDGTEYQKTEDGWKYVLTEAVVDNYVKRMREQSAQVAR